MSHVIQNPIYRRGATGKMVIFLCPMSTESHQKTVPIVYHMPITHQKYSGHVIHQRSIPIRISPHHTHVGSWSIFETLGIHLSAFSSPKNTFTINQKGNNNGNKSIEVISQKRFFWNKNRTAGIIICII
jgi:hypothetical protein